MVSTFYRQDHGLKRAPCIQTLGLKMLRVMVAFLISPVLAIFAGLYLYGLRPLEVLVPTSLVTCVITYPVVFVIGVPSFLLLRQKQLFSLWPYVAIALICAFLAMLYAVSPLDASPIQQISWFLSASYAPFISAIMGGILFWLVGIRGNVALTHPSSGTPNSAPYVKR